MIKIKHNSCSYVQHEYSLSLWVVLLFESALWPTTRFQINTGAPKIFMTYFKPAETPNEVFQIALQYLLLLLWLMAYVSVHILCTCKWLHPCHPFKGVIDVMISEVNLTHKLVKFIHLGYIINALSRSKKTIILQTRFSNAFPLMKMFELRLRFHWSLFLIDNLSALVQVMASHRPGAKPLSGAMLVSWLIHKCITRP